MSLSLGFIIKKFISFFFMPLTIVFLLGLMVFWHLHKNNIKKAKRYLMFTLVWVGLITSAPFASNLLAPLESQYSRLDKVPDNIEYLLLLGGDKEKRTWEAIRLSQQIPNLKIITSGYSMYDTVSEAQKTAALLEESGIKKENILMQGEATDTKGEAAAIKKCIGTAPFLLVTSAYHMPRSMKIFQQAGVNPIAAPADFNNPDEDGWSIIFRGDQLRKTEKALHEYLGLLWFYIKS